MIVKPQYWVIGLEGTELSPEECIWLQQNPPLGVILFTRNIIDATQVQALLDDVRQHTGKPTWATIDEEGGRINRLPFAPFNQRQTAAAFGLHYQNHPQAAKKAVYDDAYSAGKTLKSLGFTHNCAPILDIFYANAHSIIGNRAYGHNVHDVVTLATSCMSGYQAAGIAAIGKHYPGHGRAGTDSHLTLPTISASKKELEYDARTFYELIKSGLNHIMTAHIRYPNVSPDIATFSSFWLQDELQQKHGFNGTIWSDDLCMKGAGENVVEAMQQARDAGCHALLVCEPECVKLLYSSL